CLIVGASVLPFTTAAAARKSSMRELVHEPINTRSSLIDVIGWPPCRPIYSSARTAALRCTSELNDSGVGTVASIATTISGDVPQLTCGLISAALISTTRTQLATASLRRVFQYATALSHNSPFGAYGRPLT